MNFDIRLRNINVSIEAEKEIADEIAKVVFAGIISPGNFGAMSNYRVVSEESSYKLFKDRKLVFKSNEIAEILYTIEWNIVDDLITGNDDLLQFHAASLALGNNGILFVGDPGSGKTSVSILVTGKGFSFLSDEVGLVDPKQKIVIPFPRNLIIKPHLINSLAIPDGSRELMIDKDDIGKEPANYLNPGIFGKIQQENVKLTGIIFLEKHSGDGFIIEKAGQQEMFNKMMKQFFNSQSFRGKLSGILIDIIKNIPGYNLFISKPLKFDEEQKNIFANEIGKILRN